MLMAEGMIVYHGSRSNVLEYFEGFGFRRPERKGVADFLQEVVSRKDQAKYWCQTEQAYDYVSSHENAISFHVYSLSKWALFRACMAREILLMKRNSFVYIFKLVQLLIIEFVKMTVFFRTTLKVDVLDANYYLGSLFYALVILLVDGFPELSMTVARLPVFYKQRDMYFYPAWAYAIPASILKIPLSMFESITWTCLTYYVIGYSPEPGRFFRQLVLLFAMHFTSVSMFRFIASFFQTVGSISILFLLSFGGFILPHTPGTCAIISKEKLSQAHGSEGSKHHTHKDKTTNSNAAVSQPSEGKMVLPFELLTITFQDLQYHVEPPPEMREHGFTGKRLQLLRDITGAFRPGVLTTLMGCGIRCEQPMLYQLVLKKQPH